MHSFDFEECTLTFSVPVGIMNSRGFANVPGGVEVDLAAITKDASLGIKEAASSTSTNKIKAEIADKLEVAKTSGRSDMLITCETLNKWLRQLQAVD